MQEKFVYLFGVFCKNKKEISLQNVKYSRKNVSLTLNIDFCQNLCIEYQRNQKRGIQMTNDKNSNM